MKHIVFGDFYLKLDFQQLSKSFGSQITQMMKLIPFGKIVNLTKYKVEEYNINVTTIDESYTSITDSLDGTTYPSKESFLGKGRRILRGMFQSIKRKLHADVNACRNILKKFKHEILNTNWFDIETGASTIQRIYLY